MLKKVGEASALLKDLRVTNEVKKGTDLAGDLADFRKTLGLPPAGSVADKSTWR